MASRRDSDLMDLLEQEVDAQGQDLDPELGSLRRTLALYRGDALPEPPARLTELILSQAVAPPASASDVAAASGATAEVGAARAGTRGWRELLRSLLRPPVYGTGMIAAAAAALLLLVLEVPSRSPAVIPVAPAQAPPAAPQAALPAALPAAPPAEAKTIAQAPSPATALGQEQQGARVEKPDRAASRARSPRREAVAARDAIAPSERTSAPAPAKKAARAGAGEPVMVPDAPAGGLASDARRSSGAPAASFSRSDLLRRIKQHLPEIEACGRKGPFRGKDLRMQWYVTPDGRATQVQVLSPRYQDSAVGRCAKRAIEGWRFDAFSGEPVGPIKFPFVIPAPEGRTQP